MAAAAQSAAAHAVWLPHLRRGQLLTFVQRPRFTLSEMAGLVGQARAHCEQRGRAEDRLLLLLLAETEGRAYIRYGNLQRAAAVLADLPAQADRVPQSGPLHQAIIRKTVAGLHWKRGDKAAWAEWIGQAL